MRLRFVLPPPVLLGVVTAATTTGDCSSIVNGVEAAFDGVAFVFGSRFLCTAVGVVGAGAGADAGADGASATGLAITLSTTTDDDD